MAARSALPLVCGLLLALAGVELVAANASIHTVITTGAGVVVTAAGAFAFGARPLTSSAFPLHALVCAECSPYFSWQTLGALGAQLHLRANCCSAAAAPHAGPCCRRPAAVPGRPAALPQGCFLNNVSGEVPAKEADQAAAAHVSSQCPPPAVPHPHARVTTTCRPAGMFFSHKRAGQPGPITRIMCCTPEEFKRLPGAPGTLDAPNVPRLSQRSAQAADSTAASAVLTRSPPPSRRLPRWRKHSTLRAHPPPPPTHLQRPTATWCPPTWRRRSPTTPAWPTCTPPTTSRWQSSTGWPRTTSRRWLVAGRCWAVLGGARAPAAPAGGGGQGRGWADVIFASLPVHAGLCVGH